MTADRTELHNWFDRPPDDEVAAVLRELRERGVQTDPAGGGAPFDWIALGPSRYRGPADPDDVDALLAQGFGTG